MSKLEALKITECPAAMVEFARKHNALVAILASAVGANGITVIPSTNNIVVALDASVTAAIVEAQETADGAFEEITTLQGRVDTAEGAITTLQTDLGALQTDVGDHETRIAALETLLSGYADESIDLCEGGSEVAKTFLTK